MSVSAISLIGLWLLMLLEELTLEILRASERRGVTVIPRQPRCGRSGFPNTRAAQIRFPGSRPVTSVLRRVPPKVRSIGFVPISLPVLVREAQVDGKALWSLSPSGFDVGRSFVAQRGTSGDSSNSADAPFPSF